MTKNSLLIICLILVCSLSVYNIYQNHQDNKWTQQYEQILQANYVHLVDISSDTSLKITGKDYETLQSVLSSVHIVSKNDIHIYENYEQFDLSVLDDNGTSIEFSVVLKPHFDASINDGNFIDLILESIYYFVIEDRICFPN